MEQHAEHTRQSLAEKVAEQLECLIKMGRLKEGDRLPAEPMLMKKFGVGRSSIREAVKMLANAGLLSVEQGRGTFVKASQTRPKKAQPVKEGPWSNSEEAVEARALLTAAMAMAAARNCTNEDLQVMKALTSERKKAVKDGNADYCRKLDGQMLDALTTAAHNSLMSKMMKQMLQWAPETSPKTDQEMVSPKLQEHNEKLLKHIKKGNADEAAALMLTLTLGKAAGKGGKKEEDD